MSSTENQRAIDDTMLTDPPEYDAVESDAEEAFHAKAEAIRAAEAQPAPSIAKDAATGLGQRDTTTVDLAEAPFTWKTLTAVANTEFVPKAYRGQPDKMLGAILYGRESGLAPMTSLQMIDMVDGKPSMSSELMVSLVRRAGHSLVAKDWDAHACTATGRRTDTGDEQGYTFTIDMANRAGLVRKGGSWDKYPEAMLWNRSASQLIRVLFPDVLISMHSYEPDELTP